jgi:hypothetical protein
VDQVPFPCGSIPDPMSNEKQLVGTSNDEWRQSGDDWWWSAKMGCWWAWHWAGIQNWWWEWGFIAHVLATLVIILPWEWVKLVLKFGQGWPVEIPQITNIKEVLSNLKWCRWVNPFNPTSLNGSAPVGL